LVLQAELKGMCPVTNPVELPGEKGTLCIQMDYKAGPDVSIREE